MDDSPCGNQVIKRPLNTINEDSQALVNASLFKRAVQSIGGSTVCATHLGL